MKTFKDTQDRTWEIDITVATVERLRALEDPVDLMEVVGGDLIERLGSDPVLMVRLLYDVLAPQVKEQDVSPEDFGSAISGDVLEKAADALVEGIIDFFPPRQRNLLLQSWQKVKDIEETLIAQGRETLESGRIEELLKKKYKDMVDESLSHLENTGNRSGNSQEPSE